MITNTCQLRPANLERGSNTLFTYHTNLAPPSTNKAKKLPPAYTAWLEFCKSGGNGSPEMEELGAAQPHSIILSRTIGFSIIMLSCIISLSERALVCCCNQISSDNMAWLPNENAAKRRGLGEEQGGTDCLFRSPSHLWVSLRIWGHMHTAEGFGHATCVWLQNCPSGGKDASTRVFHVNFPSCVLFCRRQMFLAKCCLSLFFFKEVLLQANFMQANLNQPIILTNIILLLICTLLCVYILAVTNCCRTMQQQSSIAQEPIK